jgi:hypothetical protein
MESGRQNLPWASEIHSLSLRHLARIIKKKHLEKVYTERKKQFLKETVNQLMQEDWITEEQTTVKRSGFLIHTCSMDTFFNERGVSALR